MANVTDGEIRRESYSNHFATALLGLDLDHPGEALDRSGHPNPVPRVVGPIQRPASALVDDLRFLRAHTDRTIKITLPGPFTVSQQAQYDYYPDEEQLGSAYANSVNLEVRDLFSAGAALEHVAPERIVIATDCGMKYLPRESVMGKMRAMAAAAGVLRTEFGPG